MRELRSYTLHMILGISSSLAITACGRDLELSPPTNPADYAIAQFDPTNPIPVLTLVPTPTALVQNPDGSLNVPVAECELGTVKQCAQFAAGWDPSSPVTLFFSRDIDPASIQNGIKFWKLPPGGAPEPVEFTVVGTSTRAAPPAACETQFDYTADDVPDGIQVVIAPNAPLDPGAPYAVFVESSADGGLRAAAGDELATDIVQSSALFAIMNKDPANAPVCLTTGTGTAAALAPDETRPACVNAADPTQVIVDGLLRTQVQGQVVAALFPGRLYDDLSAEEQAQVDAAVGANAPALAGLYGYFNLFITPLANAGAIDRDSLVFATFWTTALEPTVNLGFDPANGDVPFPNSEVLTVPDEDTSTGVRVNLPVPETPGVEQLLVQNLNGLDGFAVLSRISVTVNGGELDASTFADAVRMYELDATGTPTGNTLPISVTSTPTGANTASLVISPVGVLEQKTHYIIGITRALKAADGSDVGVPATFNILKNETESVLDDDGTARDSIAPLLECSTVPVTGMLATEEQVNGLANQIENDLQRARWTATFDALEAAGHPREELIMGWSYTTQNITDTVDFASSLIGPAGWEQALVPAGIDRLEPVDLTPGQPGIGITATTTPNISQFLGVIDRFCIDLLCRGGLVDDEPAASACPTAVQCFDGDETDPQTCADARADVSGAQLCGVAQNLLGGSLAEIRRYNVAQYKVTAGNPLNPTEGAFDPARFAMPVVTQAPIWVVLPAGNKPATGWPTTIFHHGLTREKEDGFFIANSLAREGQATVLMDTRLHGERVTDIVDNTTGAPCVGGPANLPNIDPDGVVCDTNAGTCTGGCDDVPDPSGTGAISVSPFTIRDNARQDTIDYLTLLHTITEERDIDPAMGLGDLDASTLSYAGQSLGGISGANLLPYVPNLTAAALNVVGGGIVGIVHLNPTFAGALNPALVSAGVCELVDANNPAAGCQPTPGYLQFLSISQWVLEPGDPLGTSVGVTGSRMLPDGQGGAITVPPFGNDRVLIQKAIPDLVVPNSQTDLLGLSYGLNPADNSTGQDGSHFQTYNVGGPNCHGFLLLPDSTTCGLDEQGGNTAFENALCSTLGAQRQVARFVSTGGMSVAPRVFDVVPGILTCPNDFDIE